ncbi:DUF2484 family protein [Pseudooceanicola aestuarii]|uniref:DUF2484 family protein n=1 Tax=Pseudooceanicola aestuarii TaxID=2697319 RepID=UPI0013D5BED8|nr:DUF2484 family protein [Pseudooceanicola aestuarii]
MSLSVIAGATWVLAAAGTAMLPMQRQYGPGMTLLVAAPLLMGFLTLEHGPWAGLAALLAFASMFRNPLIYFLRRARGHSAEEVRLAVPEHRG